MLHEIEVIHQNETREYLWSDADLGALPTALGAETVTLTGKIDPVEDGPHYWRHYACDACGHPFTMSEWDSRETPHEPDCPNADDGDESDEFTECACDRNYHAACWDGRNETPSGAL